MNEQIYKLTDKGLELFQDYIINSYDDEYKRPISDAYDILLQVIEQDKENVKAIENAPDKTYDEILKQTISYLYDNNVRSDITIESLAKDILADAYEQIKRQVARELFGLYIEVVKGSDKHDSN